MELPSRRALLRGGVLLVASTALPIGSIATANAATAGRVRLRRSTFLPLVGTAFVLTSGGASYRAVLRRIHDLPGARGSDRAFSLAFHVTSDLRPAAGTYTVRHAAMRAFPLYVGPVTADRRAYEAVISA